MTVPNGMIDRPERYDRSDRSGRSERPAGPDRPERSEYGPPPGYQPIILPGESISKYQRMAQTRPAPSQRKRLRLRRQEQPAPPIAEIFAADEPIFAAAPAPARSTACELTSRKPGRKS